MITFKPFPEGPAKPSEDQLMAFWQRAKKTSADIGDDFEVRCIAVDETSAAQVLDLIRSRDKTGTFALPWLLEAHGFDLPKRGDHIVFTAYDGTPSVVVELRDVLPVTFGAIDAQHTALDGPPIRDVAIWKDLHFAYWNRMLKPLGRHVTDDMPVIVEPFDLRYAEDGIK